jgi:hypothetical protein
LTRINAHIPPAELCDAHLLAEYREITRVPNTIRSGRAVIKDIPRKFTLGQGHVKFFYNKIGFIKDRYEQLYDECIARGFNIESKHNSFENIPQSLMNNWQNNEEANLLIRQRIQERLSKMKTIKYTSYGKSR